VAKTIEFIFDFASPNAYLAYRALPGVLARTGAVLALTPCLLGGIFKATGNQAPMLAFAGVRGKLEYEALEMRRFVARHGLHKFRMNPHFPVNSLLMMRGLIAAGPAAEHTYVEAMLSAMWEDGLPMAEPVTISRVLSAAGLDSEAILTGAQSDSVKQTLARNTQSAIDRGVFGIPTFFVNDEMFYGKERLPQIEEFCLTGIP
jgi:2-hydroxychromene-2-carboxylate isomerase